MNVVHDKVWAIIPARGGSKSVLYKNMVNLGGRPLISYAIKAAKECKSITRIICSTEDKRIAGFCMEQDIEVHQRPDRLALDDTDLIDVLIYTLKGLEEKEGKVADMIAIMHPTSPFVLKEHIDKCVSMLVQNQEAQSAQTITEFPHIFHAYCQRVIDDGWVRFRFPDERKDFYNKQKKPKHYILGNLIVTRSRTILDGREIYGTKSLPLMIPYPYAIDVDGPYDFDVAQWYLDEGKVHIPNMKSD